MNKSRVLIVDDDVRVSGALSFVLEHAGCYEVRQENDALRAHRTATAYQPDLIILDVVMSGLDGGAVAAAIREDPQLGGIPILFFTSILTRDEMDSLGGRIGASTLLAKPATSTDVLEQVRRLLSDAHRRKGAPALESRRRPVPVAA